MYFFHISSSKVSSVHGLPVPKNDYKIYIDYYIR